MNRRSFFQQLASGLVVGAAPSLFVPKLIKPVWKRTPLVKPGVFIYVCDMTHMPDGWAATVMESAQLTAEIFKQAHPNVRKYTKLKQNWTVEWEPAQTYNAGDLVQVQEETATG